MPRASTRFSIAGGGLGFGMNKGASGAASGNLTIPITSASGQESSRS